MYDFSILRDLRKRQGLTIAELSAQSGISPAVISKLERNRTQAELETLFKLARVFGIKAAELVSLAESRTAHKKSASAYRSNGFSMERVEYENIRCMFGKGKAEEHLSKPEVHGDDYELCWVLDGAVEVVLPDERYELHSGEVLQFDAILEHTYRVIEDCTLLIAHIRKEKRF